MTKERKKRNKKKNKELQKVVELRGAKWKWSMAMQPWMTVQGPSPSTLQAQVATMKTSRMTMVVVWKWTCAWIWRFSTRPTLPTVVVMTVTVLMLYH